MKKLLLLIPAAVGAWLLAQNLTPSRPLSEITPAGAVLYLGAKDFASLLSDWSGSAEKKTWTQSASYKTFERSHLYLRLQDVFNEYADGVGIAPNMNLLQSVAGGESALAIYDISKLEFLYLTRLPSARAMESVLWKAREKFTARNAAGSAYYVKTGGKSGRQASFAVVGGLLLLSTREQSLTAALALLNGANVPAVRNESWFSEAVSSAGAAGELRMLFNMDALVRAPSFRSHWIQRNVSDLREFSAGISDLTRSSREYSERRVLVRRNSGAPVSTNGVASLLRLSPNAALYRAWAQPDAAFAAEAVARKVLRVRNAAPSADDGSEYAGEESDLETSVSTPLVDA
ncbi:MAG: hypothetical protein HYZ37_06820, partial [Candidatus Solibacter usitatus]|nr:hypothetical protein [Candidatus Solibacter usitatus]